MRKKAASAAFIREDIVADIIEWIKEIDHISAVCAPYEADWQLAFFEKKGYIDCVYSHDSDLTILGCRHVISNLKPSGCCEYISPTKAAFAYEFFHNL